MAQIDVTRHQPPSSGAEAALRAVRSTNMVEAMRLTSVQRDLDHLHRGRYGQIECSEEGLRFGTLVRMGQAEDHPVVRARYPVIRDTLMLTSSKQIRNMATLGGNLLQRNREHGVPRPGRSCVATYSGDFAQALIVLDATVDTIGASCGPRRIKFADLHDSPGETLRSPTMLQPGELITFINIPAGPWTRRSRYLKVFDASAAVALHIEGNKVRHARVAVGGDAVLPWRSHEAEEILNGHLLDEGLAARAAAAAFSKACRSVHYLSSVADARRALMLTLLETRAMQV